MTKQEVLRLWPPQATARNVLLSVVGRLMVCRNKTEADSVVAFPVTEENEVQARPTVRDSSRKKWW